ncbi:O-methyltransferase [Actinotalea ferrariae]|uniref:O-methyltransferase n=1 Tax=Actinotalea ferrariae TaxID=1386098 RepID=UPI001C8C171D|nr:O-methyltransferase [Actinotalea ferrariae]MBX9244087.1 O-methyltransferase [Actinotalea ferrariae]
MREWADVDAYLEQLFPPDDVLLGANRAAHEAGLPAIQVSAAQGRLLTLLAQVHGACRVLEFGTLAGYSTICLARGLTGARHVTTLEIDPAHAAVAVRNVEAAGLADVVDVRVGPAAETAARLVEERVEPFDLVFVDADKPSNVRYLELSLELTRPGAVIVVDNVVRGGAIVRPPFDDRAEGARAVLERVAGDPALMATAIQTVGDKGYDGFLLVRRLP